MNKKCLDCKLVNYIYAEICARCGSYLIGNNERNTAESKVLYRVIHRVGVFISVCAITLLGFYASLLMSAKSLAPNERAAVISAIQHLKASGFNDEAFLLKNLATYRSNDNWLNASVAKENAFAATNFPFGIVTLYSDFFSYPADDVERAAILLHESKHIQGEDEMAAYEFVWKNRKRIGWTKDKYSNSEVWRNVRRQTKERCPNLFVCDFNELGDCTE
ncbi:MAG: hypothetical protein ACT4O9_10685 [Blastocatellia bacterium]